RYILFHHKRHPATMGAPEISQFLSWLAVQRRVSASTQNQALSALLFLYWHVLAIDVGSLEQAPRAGIPGRVECLELRVKDVDLHRTQIVVRRGKGQKDRRTMLPAAVVPPLQTHLRQVRSSMTAIGCHPSVIRLRRICWKTGMTFGRCRNCSAMPMSRRR